MAILEGKSPSERNKLIAAVLLGVLALVALWFAFGPSLGGSSVNVAIASPTPRAGSSPRRELGEVKMPSRADQELGYMIPVDYVPGRFDAPAPRRNIFAFHEPAPPCPECPPDPTPTPKPYIPTPTPQMPYELTYVSPQNVYAGSKSFRVEVTGERFTPDAKIYFNGNELQTTFVNEQRLSGNVSANFVAGEGQGQVVVRTPDGTKYSLPSFLTVQPPPKPQFKYIGMIARRLGNNDTAYFDEGKSSPTGYRLNDVVGGRFRLINISSDRVIFEDVNLGFRHPVDIVKAGTSATTTSPGARPGFPGSFPRPVSPGTSGIPGIPDGIPRYTPPNRNTNTNANAPRRNRDADDDEDDDDPDNR